MSLETGKIERIEGLVNQNQVRAVEKYSKQLVDELVEEGFDHSDALEYLEEYVFADILANIEIQENERLEEEMRRKEKAYAIKSILETSKKYNIKLADLA